VTLAAKNIGQRARQGIEITESLSHVPEGASLDFSTPPSSYDGRQAVFTVDSLEAGAEKSFSYSIGVPLSVGAVERIPDIQVSARQLQITVAAPFSARLGERVALRAKTLDGNALQNAVLYVIYPDGQRHAIRADDAGSASFVADAQGRYSYGARDYFVSNSPYTDAVSDAAVPAAAAATTQDQGMLGQILGALPILAGVFAFTVVALMVYGFISQRREEEEVYSVQGPSSKMAPSVPDASPISYTQKFSFSQPEALREEKNIGVSEGPRGSGKMHLSESIARKMDEKKGQEEAEEETTTDETSERAMTALERKASLEGELAEGESEIEKTISQLEEIRRKLQERRSQRELEGMEGESPEKERQEEDAGEREAQEGELAAEAEASEEAAQGGEPEEATDLDIPEEKGEDVPEEEFAGLELQEEDEPQGMEKAKRMANAAKAKKKPVYAKERPAKGPEKKKKMKFATRGIKRR
jgi:hypothetical protein